MIALLLLLFQDAPLPGPLEVSSTIERGVGWLTQSQNEDGSWGGWQNPLPGDEFWSNPYSFYAWTEATTGLVAMALLEQPGEAARTAAGRAVDFLLQQPTAARPSDWDVDNTWAYIYGLQGLLAAMEHPDYAARRPQLAQRAEEQVAALARYQSPSGGWGYYDFDTLSQRPSWATSFMTAAAVIALVDAREAGLSLPPQMLPAAVRALERCRLANGAYSYNIDAVPQVAHLEWIDQVKGSLSRIQVCNYALRRAGSTKVSDADLLEGLDQFLEHHRFLDIARKKPVPHETYYYNSGYFYFFGHYYATKVLELLSPADRVRYRTRLAREITKTQEENGSMWDYPMLGYTRAYGTAFGVLSLQGTRP